MTGQDFLGQSFFIPQEKLIIYLLLKGKGHKMSKDVQLNIVEVPVNKLKASEYNPRRWDNNAINQLKESIQKFGFVDPLIVNGADNRRNILIEGHFRYHIAKLLKYEEVPVVYLDISDVKKRNQIDTLRITNADINGSEMTLNFKYNYISDRTSVAPNPFPFTKIIKLPISDTISVPDFLDFGVGTRVGNGIKVVSMDICY